METTVGQLLINEALPEDMRDYTRILDKKGVDALMSELAAKHPEKYRDISFKLQQLAVQVIRSTGGNSFDITDITKADSARALRKDLSAKIDQFVDDDKLTSDERKQKITSLLRSVQKQDQKAIFDESLAQNNPLAIQILGAGRGNPGTLASMRGSDLLYANATGDDVPVPVLRSFSEGLSPAEYWAATYGARQSVIGTKIATADAGYFGKLLNQVAHRLVVVDTDEEEEPQTVRGLPTTSDDMENIGTLLAAPAGKYPRNTVLTAKILHDLKQRGVEDILVRSPMTGASKDGGIYARDAGFRDFGRLPQRGEALGNSAAQSLAEPISQGSLNSKHTGGVAGGKNAVSGFEAISQLAMVPSTFKGGAVHAEMDGMISKIEPAPAGGHFVYIEGKEHYIPDSAPLLFKKGDVVEAGDALTEGIPNPAKLASLKSIGEAREAFVRIFKRTLKESNLKDDRRNIELIARGLINHVRLTDFHAGHSPNDVVTYSELEENYEPREDSREARVDEAKDMYLEKPYLHYTIGTKIRPSVAAKLKKFGVQKIWANTAPPPFEPEMVPADDNLGYDPDPFTRMLGAGLKKGLMDSVHRGLTSSTNSTSFVPARIQAHGFGSEGLFKSTPRLPPTPPGAG